MYSDTVLHPSEPIIVPQPLGGMGTMDLLSVAMGDHTDNASALSPLFGSDKPFPCAYPGCGKRYATKSNTKRHNKNAHNGA